MYSKRSYELKKETIENRRYLHQHAETGMELFETSSFICDKLRSYGIDYKIVSGTGVVATIGKPGKSILFRAEVDALPMDEESGLPFSSVNPGKAHTCGHDLHGAALLTAAKMLKENEAELNGTVICVFQPAEEVLTGARQMIADGLFSNGKPDIAYSCHVTPRYELGTVALRKGPAMASCYGFRITVHGKGSHGANPEDGIDPINIGSHIVIALQELIAREIGFDKRAVLTLGSFQAGSMYNTIPESAALQGTLRTFDNDLRRDLIERIHQIVSCTAKAFRGSADIEVISDVPAMINDSEFCDDISRYLKDSLNIDTIEEVLMTGSDDFAFIGEIVPAVELFLGARSVGQKDFYPGHHPKVVFDEDALPIEATMYAEVATKWLDEH